eukprot:XP_011666849.1 PREDICTED: meiosis-specific protein MEI4-like [Strongylocentrotus purpuratus]
MEATHSAPGEPSSLAAQETHDIQLDPSFVDRLKVAAATAIIKQKPATMSGKDYAKQLAERLKKKEDSWKAKANNLEMELLKTKQELLLAKTKTSLPHSINEREAANTSHSHSETNTDEPAFLTPPSSSEEYHHIDHQMALSRNTKFLHSLSTLSTLSRTDDDVKVMERSSEIIVNSVKFAVEYITGKSKGKAPCHHLSSRMLQKAADAIVKTLDTRLPSGCRDDVVSLVGELVKSVLDAVIENSKICNEGPMSSSVISDAAEGSCAIVKTLDTRLPSGCRDDVVSLVGELTYSQRESCCILLRLSKSSHLFPTILTAILEKLGDVCMEADWNLGIDE